jgi:AcrR family transcriptional regulator
MVIFSRRDRKKEATRIQIVKAGIELFSKHGIDAVTVDQIAEAADVGKGTIYNYFQTKEDVVVAFMVDLERTVQTRLRRAVSQMGPAETVLTDFIRQQFRLKKAYHAFVRVFFARMFLQTDAFLPYLVQMQTVIDPPLEELFRGLQQRGAIRQDVNLPSLIQVFKTMHLGVTAIWAIEGPPFRGAEQILAAEMKLFCEGLVTRT